MKHPELKQHEVLDFIRHKDHGYMIYASNSNRYSKFYIAIGDHLYKVTHFDEIVYIGCDLSEAIYKYNNL